MYIRVIALNVVQYMEIRFVDILSLVAWRVTVLACGALYWRQ